MQEPVIGEFCWNELATPDVQKAKDFYGKLFGWEFKDIDANEMTYTLITSQNKEIAGMWQIPAEQQNQIPPHWMAYILVKDVADSLNQAQQHGARVVKEVTVVGEMGRFAIITDPTGAHIAFWETLK